jgi:AcrR family transcriptional regulator/predicted DNA-binding transcriptional regulator AlpA
MVKPSRQTEKSSRKIRITELAQLSGVSKSTIHHYLKMGIIHPPKKLGLSLSVYDWTHLNKLKRIHEIRENQKLPLARIKEILSNENLNTALAHREDEAESLIRALEDEKRMIRTRKNEIKRIEIIDAAITLFSKNGYEKTTIEAIADSLHMAKGTVYLYFENKEDLFMECIERLTVIAVPEEDWDEIRKEQNALRRLKKRGFAFHRAFPSYKGILTMTKAALGGYNRKLAEKAKKTLSHMTRPIAKDLRRGIADGTFREIDDELVAHFILAMGEALGCRQMMDSRYTIEEGIKIMFDFMAHGILKHVSPEAPIFEPGLPSGEVTDLKGVKTMIRNIRFGNTSYLPVKIGEGEVRIDPNKLKRIRFQQQGSTFWAEITDMEEKTERVDVDGTLTLSGEVPLGGFAIELRNVTSILFGAGEPQRSQVDDGGEITP